MDRRSFLASAAGALAAVAQPVAGQTVLGSLAGQLGVTTGSFVRHLSAERQAGKLRLLDLPEIMRTRLDMRVVDLMTATLPSLEVSYLKELRAAADEAGCVLTNLKMNQPGLNLGSADAGERQKAVDEYRRTIDAAAVLGVRWVRPLPGAMRPDLDELARSLRTLIEYAAPHGITLLVENFGWLAADPEAIPLLVQKVGVGLAAQPDTGNWSNNEIRYEGLARAFPLAASCDFKARRLAADGGHAEYDLRRCFAIGWDAGFRGPWCFEYQHEDLEQQFRDLVILRDKLRSWIAARA
jgi:hypothetical protein